MSGNHTSNDILCYEDKRLVLQKYSTFGWIQNSKKDKLL